jgi:formylglycine-generating enzyme
MGSADGRPDEGPIHTVRVLPFLLGATPVTNAEYAPFLDARLAEPPPWWGAAGFDDPEQPVVGATWFDAMAFAAWLSDRDDARYRLPTEAEWEGAARDDGRWSPPRVPEGPRIAPWLVGRGAPNVQGLFDMNTLVHEWCLDWYDAGYYAVSPGEDPRGPLAGTRRSSRGGSWRHHVRWSRPSARSSLPPAMKYADYGFRVLRER